jgi:ABC transporter substrate binding protein
VWNRRDKNGHRGVVPPHLPKFTRCTCVNLATRSPPSSQSLLIARYPTRPDYAEAFRALESEPPDGLVVSNWTANWVRRQSIFDFALHRRVPVTYPWWEYVDAGGLMSYGVNLPNQYRRTADYVDKIIKGASPAELPIHLPTKFELVINRKSATAIGLEIPAHVLAQAAEVIE